ncbi:MAG: dihydroneopterin aldolase [Methylococcaceae bacterium]|nr:dihydroneopterin aldolase [Methylococcaceae bacterium]
MDIIFLRGLHIETIVGIFDWERVTPRTVVLDLEMATDNRKAAVSDAIEDALDYDAVSKRIVAFVQESRFFLVETLAERICEVIRDEFKVPWVRLSLNKIGAIQGASDVGVIIERGVKPSHG